MRRLAAILLTAVLAVAEAAPHPRPRPRRPCPVRRPAHSAPCQSARFLKDVPWQLVVAGGAAVSGVVFAYKVADGIQQGTVEAARTSPADFAGALGGFGGTVHAVSAVIVLVASGYLAWRLARRRDRLPPEPPRHDIANPSEGPPP